jgi:hypothetical protein
LIYRLSYVVSAAYLFFYGGRSDAFASVMQQWQKAVVRQQKMLQKAVLSRFIPVEGDPRLHIRSLHAQEFRGLMNQLCVGLCAAACLSVV